MAAGSCFCGAKYFDNAKHPENKFKIKPSQLPKTVRLEACNDCQLNCVECGMRLNEKLIKEQGGGFGYLKFDDFKKFVDNHPFIEEIEISNNGEIFLNPELDEIIKYAYEKNIGLTAYNGVNLNTVSEQTLENLVKYKFKGLTVSIDGASPEIYKIYRRGGDFNKVISHIELINRFKEKYQSYYPNLVYQFIVFGHNEHEIDAAKALAAKLNMDMSFISNYAIEYSPVKNPKMVQEKTGIRFVNGSEFDTFKNNEWDNVYCMDIIRFPQINFNGDLLGCCINSYKNFNVNVFKKGLLGALNSENVLRAKLMLSDFSVKPFENNPCSDCLFYHDFRAINRPINWFS